jgi:hypothetical protein
LLWQEWWGMVGWQPHHIFQSNKVYILIWFFLNEMDELECVVHPKKLLAESMFSMWWVLHNYSSIRNKLQPSNFQRFNSAKNVLLTWSFQSIWLHRAWVHLLKSWPWFLDCNLTLLVDIKTCCMFALYWTSNSMLLLFLDQETSSKYNRLFLKLVSWSSLRSPIFLGKHLSSMEGSTIWQP